MICGTMNFPLRYRLICRGHVKIPYNFLFQTKDKIFPDIKTMSQAVLPPETLVCSNTDIKICIDPCVGKVLKWYQNTGQCWTEIRSNSQCLIIHSPLMHIGDTYRAKIISCEHKQYTNSTVLRRAFITIVSQPKSETHCAGETTEFVSIAEGYPYPTIQWQIKQTGVWVNLPDETSIILRLTTTRQLDGALVRAVFSNACGSVISQSASLTVNYIETPVGPFSQRSIEGNTVTFTSSVISNPPAMVQWEISDKNCMNFTDLSGEVNSTLMLIANSAVNGRCFRARWSNICGIATSNPARLTVGTVIVVNTSQNITLPSEATSFDLYLVGGGGGGGGSANDRVFVDGSGAGGGGCGEAFFFSTINTIMSDLSISCTVGSGGSGGSGANSGGNGGNTMAVYNGQTYLASGGQGGGTRAFLESGNGGAASGGGGAPSGIDANGQGAAGNGCSTQGGNGVKGSGGGHGGQGCIFINSNNLPNPPFNGTSGIGGLGGRCSDGSGGGGGAGGVGTDNSVAGSGSNDNCPSQGGQGYGAGGGGANSSVGTAGAGAPGIITIVWYSD